MFRMSLAAILLAVFLSGCQTSENDVPSAPESAAELATTQEAEDIRECLAALFPAPGLENAALAQFKNIERQLLEHGETDDAIDKTFDLIAFALTHFGNDRLEGTGEDLAECGNLLLQFVGLDPIFPTTGLGDPDFVAEICEAGEMCEVVTDTKFAGLSAIFRERVLVTISRLPDDPGPFEDFGFDDFPLFYDISATGASSSGGETLGLTLAQDIPVEPGAVAGVCVVDPPDPFAPDPEIVDDLRLAHLIEGEEGPEVEILPLADANFLDCTGAATETPPVDIIGLDWWGRRARLAFEPVSEFLVAPLFASPGRLGGAISLLSPFGAVDPNSVGEPEPISTMTALTLNGQSTNLTIFHGQTATATATVDPAPGNELEPFVEFVFSQFSGGAGPPTSTKFLDDGEASVIVQCDALGTLSPPEEGVEISTGRFVRAEFPGSGDFESSTSNTLILACSAPID